MNSWLEVKPDSPFPIQNLPYCVFSPKNDCARVGVAIGDYVVDMSFLYVAGLLPRGLAPHDVFAHPHLNDFMELGKPIWQETRKILQALLTGEDASLRKDEDLKEKAISKLSDVQLHLPARIGAFVDFYSSEQHATNVGKMLRPDNPLMPNWKHLPVGYNGRASSVIISGHDVRRPMGQTLPQGEEIPIYGPSRNMDFELEVGFFTGRENPLGNQVSTGEVEDYIFGMVLVNDWSARDIQRWEYQPLGPFLAKSFATTISPFVIPMEALEPFRIPGPKQDPEPLSYLRCNKPWSFDIDLAVSLQTKQMTRPQTISKTNYKNMYWNMAQQLAHQCVNGTNVQVGDLYASGTVSGDNPGSYGSMLELTWRGEKPLQMQETGEERKFLQDGDTVVMEGWCQGDGYRIGFGEARGTILPAIEPAK